MKKVLFKFVLHQYLFCNMSYATIKDIAKELNISPSTVSRALRDEYNVKKETREKVLEVANRLGYTPDQSAIGLRNKKTYTIGIIVPEMITPFFITVINIVQKEVKTKGYKLIITQSQEDPEVEYNNLRLMEEYRVEGIVMSVSHIDRNKDLFLRLQAKGIQFVFFDRVPVIEGTKVIIDDYLKAFFLVEYLIRIGRKRILHLAGPSHIQNAIDRKKAYQDALAKFDIPYDPLLVVEAGISLEDGEQAIQKIKEIQHIDFDAIFSFTDTLAIGAKSYLQSHGFRIPEDVALAGFSGSLLSTIVHPQLTTVEQPLEQMGLTVAKLIIQRIENPQCNHETIILDAQIKYRGSTEKR